MKFRFVDLPKVKLPGKLYSLEWYIEPDDKDIKALEDCLRYLQKKNPYISWFVADSSTNSKKPILRYSEKTGKRGRPKMKVLGEKVKRHVHTGIMGDENNSAYSVAKNVGQSMNKRSGKKATKVISMQGTCFIGYAFRQSNSFHQGGDFDFRQCKDDFYIEVE